MEERIRWRRRAGEVLLWAVAAFVALGIGFAGAGKFLQPDRWRPLFIGWGYPGWFSLVVGAAEVAGAVGLLIPRFASYAAILLGIIMIAALLTLLGHPGGPLGWGSTPAVYVALLTVIAAARWRRRVVAAPTVRARSAETADGGA